MRTATERSRSEAFASLRTPERPGRRRTTRSASGSRSRTYGARVYRRGALGPRRTTRERSRRGSRCRPPITTTPCHPGVASIRALSNRSRVSTPVYCVATADPAIGGTCEGGFGYIEQLGITLNDGQRHLWELGRLQVWDGGADGDGETAGRQHAVRDSGPLRPLSTKKRWQAASASASDRMVSAVPSIARVEPLTTARALRGPFDYRIPSSMSGVDVGSVLVVPFGRRRVLGLVVDLAGESEIPPERLVEPVRDARVGRPGRTGRPRPVDRGRLLLHARARPGAGAASGDRHEPASGAGRLDA